MQGFLGLGWLGFTGFGCWLSFTWILLDFGLIWLDFGLALGLTRLGFRLAFGLDFVLSLAFTQILIILASQGLSELSRRSQEVLNGFLGRSWQVPRSSKKL